MAKEKEEEITEVISQREVETSQPKRIKIKIKERLSRRKKKRISLALKIILILLACFLGFFLGSRVMLRYLRYWQRPQIKYPAEESDSFQLKPDQVYSIDKH